MPTYARRQIVVEDICSSRRLGDRARSSTPRLAARGAGSRARRRLEPPLHRPPTRHRAVKRHLDRLGFRSRRVTASRAQLTAWCRLNRASRSTSSNRVITHTRRSS